MSIESKMDHLLLSLSDKERVVLRDKLSCGDDEGSGNDIAFETYRKCVRGEV